MARKTTQKYIVTPVQQPVNPLVDLGKKLCALGYALQDNKSSITELTKLAQDAGFCMEFRISKVENQ